MYGNVETGFDGDRWFNRVVGSYIVANFRDTQLEAETKGRAMAVARRVDHIVMNEDGVVVSHTSY
jgi:hypothetical protein